MFGEGFGITRTERRTNAAEAETGIAFWALLTEGQLMRALPMDELMVGMPFIDILGYGEVGVEIGGKRILVEADLWQFFVDAVAAHCEQEKRPLYAEHVLRAAFDSWIEADRERLVSLGFTFRATNSLLPEGVVLH